MFSKKQINIAVLIVLAWPGAVAVAQAEGNSVKAPTVQVIGTPEALERTPGSGEVLDKQTLEASRVFTTSEALRKLPGINVRDEEGFGLRPNIGIRGLNPTRSTKVTLLEDGVPLSYAPYGDNASYYHPPIDRYERIEVLKGAGQILYGPQTIGGVINYITPTPPATPGGSITLSGGNRDYLNGHVNYGGTWDGNGILFDYIRKQGDGARDNTHSELNDANFKAVLGMGAQQALTLRANYYSEDSNVTYSGLTQAEFNNLGARYNPFKNDFMYADRYGASATHEFVFNDDVVLTTNVYWSYFDRDWWRQSSTSTDTQCAGFAAARLAGSTVNPDTCNSIQGRLRKYDTRGIEPRLKLAHNAFGVESELEAGVKAHFEEQKRKQKNGTSPTARDGTLAEDNLRETDAYAVFAQNRFLLGDWTLTPGLRFEYIDSSRTNNLTGVTGSDTLGQWIPSLGGTYSPGNALTVFAGVHRGFAPPRTEDIIGGSGTSTDVGPELSANWEIGLRAEPMAGTNLQATLFRNDFSRQIAVGSIAGGSTPLAQGETLYQGLELSGRAGLPAGTYLRGAYTWLPTAEQTTPFTQVVGGALVSGSAAGNRLPYAPKHLLTAALGYAVGGLDAQLEAVYVSEQFSDFASTVAASANGQTGLINDYTIWNATLNYHFKPERTTVFLTVKNLADKTYI
ncbi:MAG: TonB-dependent siderophore receptor, partial [Gammaproteobacteria bacterium]|nr:TonB-dependent siderophore receptor [Gammaproteobacteria bacterium]